MKASRLMMIVLAALLLGLGIFATLAAQADESGQRELAEVRAATAEFHRIENAQPAWDLVEGLDHCFDNPGVGGMGVHYINTDLLDTTLDPLEPEALVYVPGGQGHLGLGAVEYIVPAEAWDEEGHSEPPTVLGRDLHLNEELGVYVLHAWIFKHNPAGMFEDWNPRVSCPAQ